MTHRNALLDKIIDRIRETGPLPVSAYMDLCLNDPDHGYYVRRSAIGADGDFITAPEISQIFGELLGLWCAAVWHSLGSPSPVRLIELGPGRGTLMKDALRAAHIVPGFFDALTVTLVESSAPLRRAQELALADSPCPIILVKRLDDLDRQNVATMMVANEFLDVLPRDQIVFSGSGWRQRNIGLSETGALTFVAGQLAKAPDVVGVSNDGDVYEVGSAYGPFLEHLAGLQLAAALFIDYGYERSAIGDTLQATRQHASVLSLERPGETDLTMQVDFQALSAAARAVGFAVQGPITQTEFLGALGAVQRASALMAANPAHALSIETGVQRLIAPGAMGVRFKAIGLRAPRCSPLPGFPA